MLETLRKALKSWVATALIMLLIASFAVWGIGDVFSGSRTGAVAHVGETEVPSSYYASEMYRQRIRISRSIGQAISYDDLRNYEVDKAALREMIRTAAFTEEARRLGIDAPDSAVARAVEAEMRAATGGFSPDTYEDNLGRLGFGVEEFEAGVRQRVAGGILITAVAEATGPVDGLAEAIALRQGELRGVRFLRLTADDVEAPGEPDDAALEAFYEANAESFITPERRSGRFLLIDIAPFIMENMPADDVLQAEYDARIAEFTRPATRDVDEAVFSDPERAEAFMARLREGEITFDEMVAEAGLDMARVDRGIVTEDMLAPETAAVAFGTKAIGIYGPVDLGIGASIVRVNGSTDRVVLPFEAVKGQIGLDKARDAAAEAVGGAAVEIEDMIAAGMSFDEIAAEAGVTAGSFEEVDATGAVPSGGVPDGLPQDEAFMAEVFTAQTGELRQLVELTDGSQALVQVDAVIEPAEPALEDVRDLVVAAWQAEQSRAALDALGAKLAGFMEGVSGDLRAVAAGRLTPVESIPPFDRYTPPPGLTQELVEAIFAAAPDDAVHGFASDGQTMLVVEVAEVVPPSGDVLEQGVAQLQQMLEQSYAEDTFEYYGQALEARFQPTVDPGAIEAIFTQLSTTQ